MSIRVILGIKYNRYAVEPCSILYARLVDACELAQSSIDRIDGLLQRGDYSFS